MSEDKELEKLDFMNQFADVRPDLFFPDEWTSEERNLALEELKPSKVKTGMLAAIPLICKAERCVYAETCPLLAQNVAPEGRPCPIEMAIMSQFFYDYLNELKVDPNSMVEVSMVRDLVDQEVQYLRKSKVLAQEHFIQENIIGVDNDGNPILKKELHQAVELEDRIHKRKDKLRSALLATREAKAKAGQGVVDPAQHLSQLMDDIRQTEELKRKKMKALLGQEFHDEYIDAEVVDDSKDDVET